MLALRSVTTAASAAACGSACVIQNLKGLLRPYPTLHINLLTLNPARRLQHFLVLVPACAEFALAVRRDFDPDHCCPQVRDVAEKLDRTLFVPILHFAIRWAHATERLNATLDTLRHLSAFARS